jgi:hypothetical protein
MPLIVKTPWKIINPEKAPEFHIVMDHEEVIYTSKDSQKAKLIAAAPDMLEALETILTYCSDVVNDRGVLLKNTRPFTLAMSALNKINPSQQSMTSEEITALAKQAIEMYPDKANNYRLGKTGLLGLFHGEVMKLSKGKADPKEANRIVKQLLDSAH